ncbi:hypothetical protein QFW77_09970 [Luteimonas sp. RD2P54]|uniref:Nuclear transport factor 2 family protein n=1 Tax=Luteimonas endophytica TaxID=3042023 RepID=A0ABT6J977_9GAMM|nr:hypothetical protein [Luteimonas endophytica]MDH5823309.1 hypothetical protein [Luteimonas endophytica]
MRDIRRIAWLLLAALLLAGCAATRKQADALQRQQYAWSAAIRWGDFEGAWNLVDPDYREANPMTDLEFERYRHIQVSGYRERGAQALEDGTAVREIEIGVVNRHTMTERSLRYTEQWRYDADAGQWWITNGLPDFWRGE